MPEPRHGADRMCIYCRSKIPQRSVTFVWPCRVRRTAPIKSMIWHRSLFRRMPISRKSGCDVIIRMVWPADDVIIDQPRRLHKRINRGGAAKFEPMLFQRFGQFAGLICLCRNITHRLPMVYNGLMIHMGPDEICKPLGSFNFLPRACIVYYSRNFATVANDLRILDQMFDVTISPCCQNIRVKLGKCRAKPIAFAQNHDPA